MWWQNFIGLLLFFYYSINPANSQNWPSPGFIKPKPLDKAIMSWDYVESVKMTQVLLYEEVDYNVTIADFNYKGTEKPFIQKFDNNGNNANLGAEFIRNEAEFWQIVITKRQDYEIESLRAYSMVIGINSISNTYRVQVNIINIDDNPPVIQANEKHCFIEENYEGLSNCTFLITDVDGWIDKSKFSITSTPDSGTEHFSMVPKKIDNTQYKMNAILNTTKSLDFETISVYTLGITAKDSGNNTSNNLITVVRVIDLPDMPPVWTNLINAITVLEKSVNKFQVRAIDGDYQINAAINYRIEKLEEKNDFFEVEKETGEITIKEIDRDTLKQEIFKFMIIAYEVDDLTSLINSSIVVVVNDINDHSPEIKPDSLTIDIPEETYTNLDFPESISITDPDLAENGQFDVKLESDKSWTSAFIIIPNSAYQSGTFTISVVNASLLDYEDENWRNIIFKIVATERANRSHIGVREVKINLINLNDELPIFENDNMKINVLENVTIGYHVATVFATDRDVGDKVTHSLVSQRGLEIDPETGKITTTEEKTFDHEAMPIVNVQVVATDQANHKTYAHLEINVIDVNDKPPSLILPRNKPTLEEEVPIGTKVEAKIQAKDPDTEAELQFSIDWSSSSALKSNSPVNESLYKEHLNIKTIYPDEGNKREAEAVLVVNKRIDYETFDIMYLTIVVIDLTTVHNSNNDTASLTLIILDINDNAPEFYETAEMRIQENQKNDTLIGRVTAYDVDGPGNNNVKYSMIPVNSTEDKLVHIDPKIGDIKVDKNGGIDAEIYEYLHYNITATDGFYNTILPIKIYVIDENDEYPAAIPEKFQETVHIKERSKTGTKIVQVYAFDKDRTSPFNNVSYLINSDYPTILQYFSINKFNGWLEVNLVDDSVLDRDFGQSSYTVFLKLRDNFIEGLSYNSNQNTTMVTVILDDINNQIPKLPVLSNPAKSISEETENNTLVLKITADDKDDPNTDNTKVFYEIKNIKSISEQKKVSEKCPILFKVKTVDKKHAEISTNCHMKGYYGFWAVTLYVQDLGTDPGPLNDTQIYNIQITDFNYHDPEIIFPVSGKVIRLSRVQEKNSQLVTYDGQLLKNFKAVDEDFGESGNVTFSLSSADAEKFTIVSFKNNEAQLQLKSIPDFTTQHTFNPLVTATDHGQPNQRTTTQTQKIIFVSTEGPEFEPNTFTTWFHENTTGLNNFTILPKAIDQINEGIDDETPDDIFYFLEKEDGDMAYFSLNKETRNLTLKKELDREKQEKMTLRVIATTNSNGTNSKPRDKAILTITVIVVDVNDNAPIFESKAYFGGVALEDAVGKVILSVKATDADFNDSLVYKISETSLILSDSSLEGIINPFQVKSSTGELSLGFKPTSYMMGYFSFDILVQDEASHEDSAHVKIYMIAKNNRVIFTFRNQLSFLNEQKLFIIEVFSKIFGYVCNIDYIEKSTSSRAAVSDDITSITTHFINQETNLPVSADVIIVKANSVGTISDLTASLRLQNLNLVDVPTSTPTNESEDNQDILQWVLIFLTTLFFIISIALLVAYVIRVRGLTQKLDKLAITNYDTPDLAIEKIAVMPNSNKFALEGSNPMWKTESTKEIEDNISRGSGDSDLIGIEDNPDFEYITVPKTENNGKLNKIIFPDFLPEFNDKSYVDKKNSDDECTC